MDEILENWKPETVPQLPLLLYQFLQAEESFGRFCPVMSRSAW
jgi:hypothetical protein